MIGSKVENYSLMEHVIVFQFKIQPSGLTGGLPTPLIITEEAAVPLLLKISNLGSVPSPTHNKTQEGKFKTNLTNKQTNLQEEA